jgi:serine/threonine protein phosphatase PrpC
MESFSHQTGSGQDYAGHGMVANTKYCFVMDGHGTDACIQFLRTIDMDAIALAPSPPLAVQDLILKHKQNLWKSGSTFILARIVDHVMLEIFHVGDSKAQVFINKDLIHETVDHVFSNPAEIERTRNTVKISDTKAPFPISSTEIDYVDSPVGHFDNGESLVPSQSFGHNEITGLLPGHFTITIHPLDHVRVVCGSDGFWDMLPTDVMTLSAKLLADQSVDCWNQDWIYKGSKTSYGGNIDDVSVAILDNFNDVLVPPSLCIPYSLPCFTESHLRFALTDVVPIRKIDHVGTSFFVHLPPMTVGNCEFMRNVRDKNVKLYYHDDWFWHLKISIHHPILFEIENIDEQYSFHKINMFLLTLK